MEATLRYKRAISSVREMYMLIGYIYRSDNYTPQAWEPEMMNHYIKLLSHNFADEIKAEIMSGTSSKNDVRFRLDSIFNELGNLCDEWSFFTPFKTFGEDTLLYNSLAGLRGEVWAHEILLATDEVIKVANARISGVRRMLEGVCALYYDNTPPTPLEKEHQKPKEKSLKDYFLVPDEQKSKLLEKLHVLIDGKKGKYVAFVIRSCVKHGLMSKPKFPILKQTFGEIGNISGYRKYYYLNPLKEDEKREINGIETHILPFLDSI